MNRNLKKKRKQRKASLENTRNLLYLRLYLTQKGGYAENKAPNHINEFFCKTILLYNYCDLYKMKAGDEIMPEPRPFLTIQRIAQEEIIC